MRTHEILDKAADLIEERGWTTGPEGMAVGGPHCALGAIGAVLDVSEGDETDIYRWNDNQESAQPVIEALRAAALIERAREESTVESAVGV